MPRHADAITLLIIRQKQNKIADAWPFSPLIATLIATLATLRCLFAFDAFAFMMLMPLIRQRLLPACRRHAFR